MPAPLLQVEAIDTYYGHSHVLQGPSLDVAAADVTAILGRNGSGKTTLLKSIMGVAPIRRGRILFDGSDISQLPPYRIARLGIGWVPEERAIFNSLSVHENLLLPVAGDKRRRGATTGWTLESVYRLFPQLQRRRLHSGRQLSGGEQQMLSIARSLMLNPRLLLLDEPTEGLAPVVIERIGDLLQQLKEHGIAIVLVEQNYAFAAPLVDTAVVLGKGKVRWCGKMAELRGNEPIKNAWLGL